jgi:D-beta-D-heptose 7-phosphate kinase/D-beta-D-heptose 1-phosphate adenosyltransferase
MTTIKERYVAAGQQLLRADRERCEPLSEAARAALEAAWDRALAADPPPGAVVVSDYGKGTLEAATLGRLIAAARARGVPVVVDPKAQDYAVYRGADVVTPNRRELQAATGLPTADDAEVEAACRALIERAGVAAVLATRSERGMSLVAAAGPARHLPAAAREVFDVSGAGDTVAATLAAALAAGAELETAARLANAAAGVVVGKLGTAVAHPREILRALHASDLLEAEAKLVDFEDAQAQVARWRQSGLRVGFTNGCFDLLHPGHVALLRQARAACDRLVVGLNSDASVRRLKGAERPVQGEAARAAVLASMASVDLLVVFSEDTPLKLIETLRPDVLVKGADYGRDEVVGGDLVERAGGRVLLVPLEPGHSTTATLRRLARDSSGG